MFSKLEFKNFKSSTRLLHFSLKYLNSLKSLQTLVLMFKFANFIKVKVHMIKCLKPSKPLYFISFIFSTASFLIVVWKICMKRKEKDENFLFNRLCVRKKTVYIYYTKILRILHVHVRKWCSTIFSLLLNKHFHLDLNFFFSRL